MSQLADIAQIINTAPSLSDDEAAALFLDIIGALHWEVDGVETVEDAKVFLEHNW